VACIRLSANGEPVDHFNVGGDRITYANRTLTP